MSSDPKQNINATVSVTHVIVFNIVYLSSIESILSYTEIIYFVFLNSAVLRDLQNHTLLFAEMNIFILSLLPRVCAQWHIDVHVRKMIIEYAQLLSTAHRELDMGILSIEMDSVLYRKTHLNHPCAKWVRESSMNYCYLYELFVALCDEYIYRFGKIHLTDKKLRVVLRKLPQCIPQKQFTKFPQAIPDGYKNDDVCKAYREAYSGSKRFTKAGKPMDKWTLREIPEFMRTNQL